MEALPSFIDAYDFIKTVTASASAQRWEDGNFDTNSACMPFGIMKRKIRTTSRCKLVLRYRVASELTSFLAQTGFTNPINLAWEVLPFSFVVDWFLPIGPWLETLSAWNGLEFVGGSQTLFTRGWTHLSVDYQGPCRFIVNDQGIWVKHSRFSQEVVLLDRSTLGGFPTQTLPTFKNPLSVTHASNALALVRSVFK